MVWAFSPVGKITVLAGLFFLLFSSSQTSQHSKAIKIVDNCHKA